MIECRLPVDTAGDRHHQVDGAGRVADHMPGERVHQVDLEAVLCECAGLGGGPQAEAACNSEPAVKPYEGPSIGADNRSHEERAEAIQRHEEQKKQACENYSKIPANQRRPLEPADQAYCDRVAEEREDHDPTHRIGKSNNPTIVGPVQIPQYSR